MKENTNFFARILQIMEYQGIKSVNSFAKDYLNYESSEKLNRLGRENSNPSYEILQDIAKKFAHIDANWLLTGEGEMLKTNRPISAHNSSNLSKTAELEANSNDKGNNNFSNNQTKNIAKKTNNINEGIPLIPLKAIAGFGEGEMQVMEYECQRYVIPMFEGADFLITVKGSSMQPKYNNGDAVACKRIPMNDIFFQWNKVYVLDTIQGPLVKRVKRGSDSEHILIVSDNPSYEPFELHLNKIYGVAIVLGVLRLE